MARHVACHRVWAMTTRMCRSPAFHSCTRQLTLAQAAAGPAPSPPASLAAASSRLSGAAHLQHRPSRRSFHSFADRRGPSAALSPASLSLPSSHTAIPLRRVDSALPPGCKDLVVGSCRTILGVRRQVTAEDIEKWQEDMKKQPGWIPPHEYKPMPFSGDWIYNIVREKDRKWVELIRLHVPMPILLLWFPSAFAMALAEPTGVPPDAASMGLFLLGSLAMRSAGCIINDLWDKDIDKKVERTKNRPIASGRVSEREAMAVLAGCLGVGALVLAQFNTYCILTTLSSVGLVVVYPLMKRYTNMPQMFLGLTYNWGVMAGWSAIRGCLDQPEVWIPLYAGCVCWTIVYDTLYAHMDKEWDKKIGVKSTALLWGEEAPKMMFGFTALMGFAWVLAGVNIGMGGISTPYYPCIAGACAVSSWLIASTKYNRPEMIPHKFRKFGVVGVLMLTGCIGGTLLAPKRKHEFDLEAKREAEAKVAEKDKVVRPTKPEGPPPKLDEDEEANYVRATTDREAEEEADDEAAGRARKAPAGSLAVQLIKKATGTSSTGSEERRAFRLP